MNDLENLIKMANIVAKPWKISVAILSLLLLLSVGANVYLATIENEVIIEQDNNFSDYNKNGMNN